jgi:hypothetical protein
MQKRPPGVIDRLKPLILKGHFAMLLGAGASVCAGYPPMDDLTKSVLDELPRKQSALLHEIWDGVRGRDGANIETVLGQLYHLLATSQDSSRLVKVSSEEVRECVSKVEAAIARPFLEKRNSELHRRLIAQCCRFNTKEPPVIATSNYDMLVERACDAAGIWCLDGFVGISQRRWRVESLSLRLGTVEKRTFRDFRGSIRLLKLHGSVSWGTDEEQVTAYPDGSPADTMRRLMIFPSPRKVSEIHGEPYSSLLRQFSNAIERKNALLFTAGFSYRDAHLVEPIKQFVVRRDHTLVALVRKPEGALNQLLGEPNVICIAKDDAWLTGRRVDAAGEMWQLPQFVEFLEGL